MAETTIAYFFLLSSSAINMALYAFTIPPVLLRVLKGTFLFVPGFLTSISIGFADFSIQYFTCLYVSFG